MRIELDKRSPVPFYRQIVDMILAGVAGCRILPGDKLPTIRELAVSLSINPNTVVKAYNQLQFMQILETQQGSGVFVHPQAMQTDGCLGAHEGRQRQTG